MIIDFKYHIASLVAIFLALGIGILIGSTMLGNDKIIETQKQITNNLEQQLGVLREKNEAIEAKTNSLMLSNSILKDFNEQTLPILIENRLAGKKVAIIYNTFSIPENLKNILQMAGANVTSETTIINSFNISDNKVLPTDLGLETDMDIHNITQILSREVGKGILTNQNNQIINDLTEKEFINVEGVYGEPIDAVIIVGGSREEEKYNKIPDVDYSLIEYFYEKNIQVYGLEKTEVEYSFIKDYQKKGITTVDNIDTVPGQMALVLAMQGNPGHYGIKETAQRLLPSLGVAVNGQ